ncbi:MAG TPA: hypothetical protein VGJ28_10735, partial [Micromonosporaceae bacterium]|jgi:hypothetical protein
MPRNPLDAHPPWRQLVIVSAVVPILLTLAVLAFTWPASRTAPNRLPLGIVSTGTASQKAGLALSRSGFELHLYPTEAAARTGIADRDVYGALDVAPTGVTVLTASAASPAVAQILTTAADKLAVPVTVDDVVPTSPHDPKGAVFASTVLPLVLGGEILAVVIAALVGFAPAWRQTVALALGAAGIGAGAYAVVQGFLGALPGDAWATWGALAAMVFAIAAATAGLFDLIGGAGIGIVAATMIFVGNPFSGVTSAPDLLPSPVNRLGQWLPPGAGGNLLRDTAYFGGHGATTPVIVLAAWSVAGLAAIVLGHRYTGRHAVHHLGGTGPASAATTSLQDDLGHALVP